MAAKGDVRIIGIGPGDIKCCTEGAKEAILWCDVLVGAPRMLEIADKIALRDTDVSRIDQISPTKVQELLKEFDNPKVCIVCSGDTGFYSLAKSIADVLDDYDVQVLPGIATVQYLAAKTQRSWQECALRSAHGKSCNIVGEVLANSEVFFLTGGEVTPNSIISELVDVGMGDVEVTIGENLSYPDELIQTASAKDLVGSTFSALSSVWVRRGNLRSPEISAYGCLTSGIPDEAFVRGKTPMTKQEVRSSIIAKLNLGFEDIVWDIGAGTGSVSVEIALASPMIKVFSIEIDDDACDLIEENRQRFAAYNISLIKGEAPKAVFGLPNPDAVFIGGSKGNLENIVDYVLELNPRARIVASAISIETISEAEDIFSKKSALGVIKDFEVTQIAISRTREVGNYHLLTAQNPIMLFSACGVGA